MAAHPKRILIVAHDPMLKVTRAALLEHKGYEVAAVETAEEALAKLEAERFDLVLLGRKARQEARALDAVVREIHPTLPILRITPFRDDTDANEYATWSTSKY